MKKSLSYILTIITSVFIGCGIMYGIVHFFPTLIIDKVSTVESKVTVTDSGISAGIKNVYDSVVVVENYQKSKLYGIGSGFIYSSSGYIMTNHHVIDGANEVKIILSSGDTLNATVVGSDEYSDIAVLKIDKQYAKNVATIGKNDSMNVGDTVFTIGSPISADYAGTVTRGILSGKNRMVEVAMGTSSTSDWIMNVMQTDAAINPGNSGGPLCNVSGEVIGITSMKIVQSSIEGVGFAIPIEDAMLYANKIVNGESMQRAYLGIEMYDLSIPEYYLKKEGITIDESITSGVIVINPVSDGPASKAGIKKGDVITKIGEYSVNNVAELRYYLYKHSPNETIDVEIVRGKTKSVVKVTLGDSK